MTHILCIGQAVQDFVFSLETFPQTPDKHRADRFETMGGGPAATAAVTISRLGGKAKPGVTN
jgi:sulfofructose kinase